MANRSMVVKRQRAARQAREAGQAFVISERFKPYYIQHKAGIAELVALAAASDVEPTRCNTADCTHYEDVGRMGKMRRTHSRTTGGNYDRTLKVSKDALAWAAARRGVLG